MTDPDAASRRNDEQTVQRICNPIRVSRNFWELPELTEINRLPAHSCLVPYADRDAAVAGRRDSSPWYRSLNGEWKFRLFPGPAQVDASALAPDADDSSWRDIPVPCSWTTLGLGDKPHFSDVLMPFENVRPLVPEDNAAGVCRVSFSTPESWRHRRVVVHFGGVESYFEVHLNGRFIGMGKDTRLPSEFDVTAALDPDGENALSVMVARYSDSTYVEDQDHWWHAGIFREVYLYSTDQAYVEDVHVDADLDPASGTGLLSVRTKLNFVRNEEERTGGSPRHCPGPERDYAVDTALLDDDGTEVFARATPVSHSFRVSGYVAAVEARIPDIRAWSSETPSLYTLAVTLRDADGRVIDVRSCRVGFRNVAVRDRQLLVNGRPVLIKGANYHEHDDEKGKTVSRETMIRDIGLLKQFNFNAVRTSHYPIDAAWYELCDEYGIYVLCEANLEAHDNYATMPRDPRWARAFVERGLRMARTHKNHPCIFGWSLGNETGNGENHDLEAAAIRAYDPSRIIHHEGELKLHWHQTVNVYKDSRMLTNDFADPMYDSIDGMLSWAKEREDTRPFIYCEYNPGASDPRHHWEAFRTVHGLQGGFQWQWLDHGIAHVDEKGRRYWLYGGDMGEPYYYTGNCVNGVVLPDRRPRPILYDFKKAMQPLRAEIVDWDQGLVRITNEYDFVSLEHLKGTYAVSVNGRAVAERDLPRLDIAPGESRDFKLDLAVPQLTELAEEEECHLTLRFFMAADTPGCDAGHEVAWEQFEVPVPRDLGAARPKAEPERGEVSVNESGDRTVVSVGGLAAELDADTSSPVGLSIDGRAVLTGAPALVLARTSQRRDLPHPEWRPPDPPPPELHRLVQGERRMRIECDGDDVVVSMRTRYGIRNADIEIPFEQDLQITPAGRVVVGNAVEIDERLGQVARLAVQWQMPPGFEDLEWFGRGPNENRADCKSGSPVGRYSGRVSEQYFPYTVPKAHGEKSDVRWFSVGNGSARVRFESGGRFEFSAHHFTEDDIFESMHSVELEDRMRPETVMLLDFRGQVAPPAGRGPVRVGPGRHEFTYTITPLAGG
jgi:beta-galactosidase